jgi:CubicO group peptidase (beta-lactamase class C family)
MMKRGCWIGAVVVCVVGGMAQAQTRDLAQVPPESVGFSSERLARLDAGFKALIEKREFAGLITAVTRHGQLVHFAVQGAADRASGKPLQRDALFRIYSMTKPITGVALMMLHEEGRWHPDEPLAKHLPELAALKVYAGTDKEGRPILEAPAHPPTVGELLTHTAGFTYGFFGDTPVDQEYRKESPLRASSCGAFLEKLARLPLLYQPGERWVYSVSVDVQGCLVERLSGKSLPAFLQERIFAPLNMRDTAFAVPVEKLSRLATMYSTDMQPEPHDAGVTTVPGFASGGGGLYSTTTDYLRFAQMLANGGELDGVRLLAPSSVELMRANHLPAKLMMGQFGIGAQQMRPGFGFGYDVAVFTDPTLVGSTTGQGTYLWDGAAATWFFVDPTNDVVFVGMVQRRLGPTVPNVEALSRALTYQALVDPRK